MTKEQTYELCKQIAPVHNLDPIFVLAICEQESAYNESEARLENGFYRKYVRPDNLPTTTEILLAASYGLMQLMGDALKDLKIVNVTDYGQAPRDIDDYMVHPEKQIESGCLWLWTKVKPGEKIMDVYWRYNGAAIYKTQVDARYAKLKAELG